MSSDSTDVLVKGTFEFLDAEHLRSCLDSIGVVVSDRAANFMFVMGCRVLGLTFVKGSMTPCLLKVSETFVQLVRPCDDEPRSMEDELFEGSITFPRILLAALPPVSDREKQREQDEGKRTLRISSDFREVLRTVSSSMVPSGVLMLTPQVFRNPQELYNVLLFKGGLSSSEISAHACVRIFQILLDRIKGMWVSDHLPMIMVNVHEDLLMFVNTTKVGEKNVCFRRPGLELVTFDESTAEIAKSVQQGLKVARSAMSVERSARAEAPTL